MSCDNGEYRQYKGFACVIDKTKGFFSQHPLIRCINCKKAAGGEELIFDTISEINDSVCILKPHGEHTEIAQLILWREDSEKIDRRSIFRVSLIGSSGPATLGAAMLFVDEEQKERYLKTRAKKEKEEREEQEEFLSELQEIVRGKFMKVFMKRLTDRLHRVELTGAGLKSDRNGSNKECYFYLVKCAVQAYLSTVLYRYFLPFLSERDIERIHNGMQSFLDHMKAAGESPFALDYKDMEETGETVASNFAVGEDSFQEIDKNDSVIWKIDINEMNSKLPEKYLNKLNDERAYLFTIDMLNDLVTDIDTYDDDMGDAAMVLIEPPSIDQRIINQYSYFMLVPKGIKDIEDFFEKQTDNTVKYVIPKELKWRIRDFYFVK